MVRVTVRKEGYYRYLNMRGHAGYNSGNDIVCAGCSAIAYALLGWMENHREPKVGHNAHVEDGIVELCSWGDDPAHMAAFDMAVIGLAQIEAKYPECVAVEGWV